MCVSRPVRAANDGVQTMPRGGDTLTRSWDTTYRQPIKTRLPRLLTGSAKIDLNLHWSALEQLVSCMPPPPSVDVDVDVAMHENAVNENLANERLEAASLSLSRRFVFVDVTTESPVRRGVMRLIKKLAQ